MAVFTHHTEGVSRSAAPMKLVQAFVVALTMGTALATQVPRPPCLVPYEAFEYTGCFKDLGSPPALEWRTLLDQNAMTIELCTAYCKGNSNRYAGLSYYGVCYCGMSIEGPKTDESECNLPCSGNKDQICGGNNHLSVWEDPTFPPMSEASVDEFDAIGCWTDESGAGRALAYRQDMDASSMTNGKCQQKCLEGGYPLAGTEFAGECYCGAVMSMDTKLADSSDCNLPCNGDNDDICGGHSRMNIFKNDGLLSSEPCGSSPALPSSVAPTEPGASGMTIIPPASSSAASTTSAATTTTVVVTGTAAPTTTTVPSSSVASTSSTAPTISSASTTSAATTTTVVVTGSAAPTTSPAPSSTTPTTTSCVPATTAPDGHPPKPTCEYSVGAWCSHPLPPFHDIPSCLSASAHCALQSFTCHRRAGLLQHVGCLAYTQWCLTLKAHCLSSPSGGLSKQSFFHTHPPRGHSPSEYHPAAPIPCHPPPPKDQCPLPSADTLCLTPKGHDYPLGHIAAPVVTCNDLAPQHAAGQPFKLYTEGADTHACRAYARTAHLGGPKWGREVDGAAVACADACREQHEECVRHWAEPRRGYAGRRVLGQHDGMTYHEAVGKCREQEGACLKVNKGVSGEGKCERYCEGT